MTELKCVSINFPWAERGKDAGDGTNRDNQIEGARVFSWLVDFDDAIYLPNEPETGEEADASWNGKKKRC